MKKGSIKKPNKIVCAHDPKPGQYSILSPGNHLQPVSGKVYWHIDESTLTNDMEKYKVIFAFSEAFAKWQPYFLPITFQSTGTISQAQIVVKFANNGDNWLPQPFDSGVLAYAYAPRGTSYGLYADVFVNDLYNWQEMHTTGGYFLMKVIVHELGHCFNLGHSQIPSDILYWQYQPNNQINITSDSQNGIYNLYKQYGVKSPTANFTLPSFVKSLIKTKYDLSRMNGTQHLTIANAIGVTFSQNENTIARINKLYNKIATL